jgi:tetratricopeptide (TPR) repeat protein
MNKKAFTLVLVVFCLICIRAGYADGPASARSLFRKGNTAYSREDFESAITYYRQALSLGYESGPLYYNMGNAYFKSGSLGKAVLNYLRARRLMPQDADLLANLSYARSLVKMSVSEPEKVWFIRPLFYLTDAFNLNILTVITVVLYWASAGLIIFIIRAKPKSGIMYLALGLILVFVVFLAAFSIKARETVFQKQAVVVVEFSEAKFEPFEAGTTHFTLYEGQEVRVIAEEGDWFKVRRPDAKQAWLKKSDVELL